MLTRQETTPTITTLPPATLHQTLPVSSEHHLLPVLVYYPTSSSFDEGQRFNAIGVVAGTVLGVTVAFAPVVIHASLSIAGASAAAVKLPPQVDPLVEFHLTLENYQGR